MKNGVPININSQNIAKFSDITLTTQYEQKNQMKIKRLGYQAITIIICTTRTAAKDNRDRKIPIHFKTSKTKSNQIKIESFIRGKKKSKKTKTHSKRHETTTYLGYTTVIIT